MKTALKVLAGILALLLVAIVALPFVIDVNKYRPQILQAANEKLNGKLDIGKLSLSLWGKVKVGIDGLTLVDAQGTKVIAVKDAALDIPILSLLTGSPSVSLVLDHPEINIVKDRQGRMNVLSLMKESPAGAPSGGAAGGAAGKPSAGGEAKIPPILLSSRFTLLIEHARVAYKDLLAGSSYDVPDFSFHLRDVSPTSKMPFDAEALLDLKMAPNLAVKGPLKLDGSLEAKGPSASPFEQVDGQVRLSLDDADIEKTGALSKRPGVPLRLEAQLTNRVSGADLNRLFLRLADVTLEGKATTRTEGATTTVSAQVKSSAVDLSKLGGLLPAVGVYGLNGTMQFEATVSGPTDNLAYAAFLKFSDVAVKTAAMAETLRIAGAVNVATNEIKSMNVSMKAPGFDGSLSGALSDFQQPKFRFAFVAKEADMDKLFPPAQGAAAKAEPAAGGGSGGSAGGDTAAGEANYNAMFQPLRANPMAAAASGTFDVTAQTLKTNGMILKNVKGQFAMNDLLLQLKGFSFGAFDGSFKMDASINAKQARPQTAIKMEIAGMETKRMAESRMTFAKNTVSGVLSTSVNIGGAGLNRSDINSGWKGGGSFGLVDAKFSSLDIGRAIKEGLVDKLPAPVQSRVKVSDKLLDWKGEYQKLDAKFALDKGTLNLSELTGKAVEGRGMDLKGTGTVSIVDYTTDVQCDFIDKYQMLGDRLPKDKRYGAATISTRVKGTLFSPKYDWGYSIQQLAKNALQDSAKEKAGEAVGKQLDKVVPEDAAKKAKSLLKKFF